QTCALPISEGAGFREEDREQQRHGNERALAGREQVDALGALAARRRVDLDLALQRLVFVGEPYIALPSAEQRLEHRAEVLAYLPERLEKHQRRRLIDLAGRPLQRLARRDQVVALRHEELEPLPCCGAVLDGQRVDRADGID